MSASVEPPHWIVIRNDLDGELYVKLTDVRAYLAFVGETTPEHAETLEMLDDAIVASLILREEEDE